MKKILLIIGVVALIDSCKKKEEPLCNCGIIESDNVRDFSILIRNECTDNYKTFYLNQSILDLLIIIKFESIYRKTIRLKTHTYNVQDLIYFLAVIS